MCEILNITEDGLLRWAKDPNAFEPMQDWDLIVGSFTNIPLLAKLGCVDLPQRNYIVHYLHVATADAYHHSRDSIAEAISLVSDDAFEDMLKWRDNAEYLIQNPNTYKEDYSLEYMNNLDDT